MSKKSATFAHDTNHTVIQAVVGGSRASSLTSNLTAIEEAIATRTKIADSAPRGAPEMPVQSSAHDAAQVWCLTVIGVSSVSIAFIWPYMQCSVGLPIMV